jgi:hypothetical protein
LPLVALKRIPIAVPYVVLLSFITVVLLHRVVERARLFFVRIISPTRKLFRQVSVVPMEKLVGLVALAGIHHLIEGDEYIIHRFVVTCIVVVLCFECCIASKHIMREGVSE